MDQWISWRYDWSVGAFRTRMRCLPMLQPRAQRHAANRDPSTPYVPVCRRRPTPVTKQQPVGDGTLVVSVCLCGVQQQQLCRISPSHSAVRCGLLVWVNAAILAVVVHSMIDLNGTAAAS